MHNQQSSEQLLAQPASKLHRTIIWLTLMSYVGQPLLVAAQVIADQTAAPQHRPVIDTSANGLPLVQITTPSAAGVSRNQYNQYNVDPQGLILNNSSGTVLTQQAGYVTGNQNLATGAARIILNEVTGTNASQLNGYTEVAGSKAEVIIANPNGISCNGCGFINTSRGILTTGTPVFGGAGSLDAFRVTGGSIAIGTNGLNGSNLDQLDLIARSVQANGKVWANTLNAIVGANQVNHSNLGTQTLAGTGTAPTVGIDVALLGGMYANKITLISTEAGIGVNSAGTLAAYAGDLTLDTLGRLTLTGNTQASGNLTLGSATGTSNSGTVYSQGNTTLTSTGDINNNGTLAAAGNLTLNAINLTSTGTLAAGVASNGSAIPTGNLNLTASGQASVTGNNLAGGSINMRAATLNLAGGQSWAGSGLDLTATAGNIDNSNGALRSQTGLAKLTASGTLLNGGGIVGSGQDLAITASTLSGNGSVLAGRDAVLSLQGNYTNALGNTIQANRNLSLSTTGNLINTGTLQAVSNVNLSAANITNQGTLAAGNQFAATTTVMSNTGSIIGGDISITASQKIENVGATAFIGASNAAGTLELLAPVVQNRDDTTATDTPAQTTIMGLGKVVFAGGKDAAGLYTPASQILNQSGLIQSGGDMQIYANTLTNTRRILQMSNTFTPTGTVTGRGYWTPGSTVPGGAYPNMAVGGAINSSYLYTTYTGTTAQNSPLSISPEAQIIAGGNLTPSVALLQNYWSKVTAAGNIGMTGVVLDQNSWRGGATPFLKRTTYTGDWWYLNYTGAVWSLGCGFGIIGLMGGCAPAWGPQITDTPLPGYDSSVTAKGNIVGKGVAINNTAGTSPAMPLGAQTPGTATSALGKLTLPQGGLYTTNTAPQAKYLVATNPAFTNRQLWLSSDWYFQRAGIDPGTIQKRLGDGFYEQQLVQQQIMSLTGRATARGYANEEAQFRDMMSNGVKLFTSLNIRPGIALTAEQVAQLTDNVIIMETRVVEGQSVLVPVVYLAKVNQGDLLGSGPLIAASNIILDNVQGFSNSGTIKADNYLGINAVSTGAVPVTLDNRGGNLQSGGLMLLNASGDIDLTSARVKAGGLQLNTAGNLLLNTDAKQIGNEAQRETHTQPAEAHQGKSGLFEMGTAGSPGIAGILNSTIAAPQIGKQTTGTRTATQLGRTASLDVAGDANINVGKDFQLNGASLNVGGNLAANVDGNWQIGAQQIHETTSGNAAGTQYNTDLTRNVASQITVGGQSHLNVGKDFIAQGAQIDLKGGGVLQAGGNVQLVAVKDRFSSDSVNHSAGHYGRNQSDDETVKGTTLNSDADFGIYAGKDITLKASSVSLSQGQATLAAAGNINIQTENEHHQSLLEDSGSHGNAIHSSSKTERTSHDSQQAIGSNLDANTILVHAGKDLNVTGSNLVASNDVVLKAGNNVSIKAATSTRTDEHYLHESSNGLEVNSHGITDKGPEVTQRSKLAVTTQSTNQSLVQSKHGNLTVMAGNTIEVVGSQLIAAPPTLNSQNEQSINRDKPTKQSINRDTQSSRDTRTDTSTSQGQIKLSAGNAIALLAGQDTLQADNSIIIVTNASPLSKQKRTITDTTDITTRFGSTLKGDAINLNSGGDAILQGTDAQAGKGGMNIDAGGDVKLLAALSSHSHTHQETLQTEGVLVNLNTGGIDYTSDRRKNLKDETQNVTAQATQLTSAGDIRVHAGGDTTLQGSSLNAQSGIDLSATGYAATKNADGTDNPGRDGKIIFQGVKTSRYTSHSDQHNSSTWQSNSGNGDYTENLQLANITSGKGLSVTGKGGIEIDIPKAQAAAASPNVGLASAATLTQPTAPLTPSQQAAKNKADLDRQIDTLAKTPGQEWLGQLAKRDDVQFKQVKLAAQHWDYSHDGLTPEAAGVIVIAVTYLTAGAASGAAGSIVAGAGATGTTATVATTALATGMTTLASQASLALINNQGDLGKTLNDLGRSENIKALTLAMVTAGALQGLNTRLGIEQINAQSSFTNQLQKNLINQSSSAVINHAINGGDLQQQLEQSLKNAFIDTGAAQTANLIGDMKLNGNLNAYTHKLAHAIAGCAAGAAKSNECSSGALGAVVGELSAELYAPNNTGTPLTAKQQTDTVNFAKLMAGIAVAITGGDANAINLAASAGGNAAENNRLLHMNETNRIVKMAKGDPEKEARLNDAACYLVHCAEQYPEGTQERRYYQSVEARGQANSYELQQLADAQKTDPTLFNYSFGDKGLDLGKKTLDTTLVAAGKVVDLGKGVAIGVGDTIVQAGALALDAAQLAGAGVTGDTVANVDPVSGLGKAIQQNGVIDTVAKIPGNTLRGVADAAHAAGQGELQPLGEVAGAVAVPVVAGKVLGGFADGVVKRPDFYVTPDGVAVPATGYRAIGGEQNILEAGNGVVSPRDPTYLTFDNITNMPSGKIKDLLQLEYPPTHVISFDTKQILNDLTIPNGRWGNLPNPEPLTSTFPEWGAGGGTQAITNLPIKVDKLAPVVKP